MSPFGSISLRETALAGYRPHRGRYFAVPVTAAPRRGPNGKNPALVGLHSPSISPAAKPRWPVIGPTGAAILPFPSRLRRAGAPTAKTRRLSGFIRPPFRLRRNRAGRSSAPPGPLFCRSRHGCAAPGPQRQNPGACRRSAPFRLRETARPDVSPAGGNVLAAPFSLCSNVAPHIPAGSAGVRSFVPRLAPRSHPGAQLRFILKQLYASGCPFLRNFPFFSSVPHPFFASAPGRTDTQKSAAGIPRRGFNTFSVSWLYFPLPNT